MDNSAVEQLYKQFLDAWNNQDASGYASLFAENGSAIGFDGSQMNGAAEIKSELSQIFTNHKTAAYIAKVREVRFLNESVALQYACTISWKTRVS